MANVFTPNLVPSRNQRIVLTDYVAGTLAATNGNTAVVGTGTQWSAENAGFRIVIAGVEYQIASVADTTHAVLATPFAGSTASGLAYAIRDSYIKPPANVTPGTWRMIIDDPDGGHNAIFDPLYFYDANVLSTAPNRRSHLQWLHHDGMESLTYVLTDQPIPA